MSSCPHCGAVDPGAAAFCVRCGKAMPQASGPKIVREKDLASSSTGQNLQSQELAKKARSASTTLIVLAVLQFLASGVLVFAGMNVGPEGVKQPGVEEAITGDSVVVIGAVIGVLAAIFLALGIWARRSPLPAAITGLTLYVTLMLAGAALDPASLVQGIILKAIIILFLVRAIQAGFQHRALLRKMNPA